jgi:release factor glutamine methyltransferase
MKTLEEAIRASSECLAAAGLEDARRESEHLLAALLKISRSELIFRRHERLPANRFQSLQRWLRQRQERKPLAYVCGEQPFRDLTLRVNGSVLIPRPETELLVEQTLRLLDRCERPVKVVDVGTGSGNIALCLARHPNVEAVIGIDISAEALAVARQNSRQLSWGGRCRWLQGHLLDPVMPSPILRMGEGVAASATGEGGATHVISMVVANLPYVRTLDMAGLEPELHWEPRLALDGGDDGLKYIKPCIEQSEEVLPAGGSLLLEIGIHQAEAVTRHLTGRRAWQDTQVFYDWSGVARIVQSKRKAG